ncbi:hypothetical protein IAU59_004226 [Kwoniella sp. CBS 9459]
MVEIITHDVQLIAAHIVSAEPASSQSSISCANRSEITLTSSSSDRNGRYRVDLDHGNEGYNTMLPQARAQKLRRQRRDKVVLSFFDPKIDGEETKRLAKVEFALGIGNSLKRIGWERLAVYHSDTQDGGGQKGRRIKSGFSAYRLIGDSVVDYSDACQYTYRQTILIFAQQDTANFLSRLPDDTPLGDLTLPGTHESCALFGYPISQCQQPSTPISQQLMDGVRFLDVRLRVVGEDLLMYHGPRPQRSSLTILLSVLHDFLASHPGETLILCIKQETPPWHPHFSSMLYRAFKPFLDKWFMEERIPVLSEVRGKGILLSRFDRDSEGDEVWGERLGMGIHPSRWPDSRKEGFEWDCEGTTVRTQDWYRVHTFLQIPEKFQAITSHLAPATVQSSLSADDRTNTANTPFTLSYTSASYFPLSLPTIIAKGFGFPAWGIGVEGINTRFCRYLLGLITDGKRIRATVAIDFYRQCGTSGGNDLADLLVLMNFIGGNEQEPRSLETIEKNLGI